MANENRLFKIEDFAAALDVKPSCIKRWILERRIASVKVGRRLVRIPAGEIDRIVRDGLRPAMQSRRTNTNNERGQADE
jgi:excisionase family DNA binding protein